MWRVGFAFSGRYRGPVPNDDRELNALIGRVLKAEYGKRGMLLEDLARRANIPYGTLRRKIAGGAPLFTTELLAVAEAMDPPLDPRAVLDQVDELWAAMSPAAATNDLQQKRSEKQAAAAAMTPAALDKVMKRAATTDPELGQDEPPTS